MNKYLYGLGTGILLSALIVGAKGGGLELLQWLMPMGMVCFLMPVILNSLNEDTQNKSK